MKTKIAFLMTAILLLSLIPTAFAQDAKITVLNPKGYASANTFDPDGTPPGKPGRQDRSTSWISDTTVERACCGRSWHWFTQNIPTAKLVFREKAGSHEQEDTKLWAEIKAESGCRRHCDRSLKQLRAGGRRPLRQHGKDGKACCRRHHKPVRGGCTRKRQKERHAQRAPCFCAAPCFRDETRAAPGLCRRQGSGHRQAGDPGNRRRSNQLR